MSEILSAPHSSADSTLPSSVFVGRNEPVAIFRQLLEADSGNRGRVLIFHGSSGCGKSTLLRVLQGELQQNVASSIPCAGFNLKNLTDRTQAYREVLLSWRIALHENFAARFPHFDLCLALIMASEGGESPFLSWSPALSPLVAIAKALLVQPQEAPARWERAVSSGDLSADSTSWLMPGEDGLPLIQSLCQRVADRDPSVAVELVDYFAADLSAGLKPRPDKAIAGVLFLDSYESLWPGGQILRPELTHHIDWWLRELAAFFLMQGVLLVIGARHPLNWAKTDEDWADRDLEQLELHGLTPVLAQEFLARCRIGPLPEAEPSALQRAIIRSCSSTRSNGFLNQWTNRQLGESLPLWLALCADMVQNARLAGKSDPGPAHFALVSAEEPGKKLGELFLKSFASPGQGEWLGAVAVAPRCDERAANAVNGLSEEALFRYWERFTQLSCVEDQGDGFYRIESAVRSALGERRHDQIQETHLNFCHHWTERGEEALLWFHKWAIDPEGSLEAWKALHAEALAAGDAFPENLARARNLLSWWDEVAFDQRDLNRVEPKTGAKARITLAAALLDTPYLTRAPALALAQEHLEAALNVCLQREFPRDWAQIQILLARTQRALASECSDQKEQEAYFNQALEGYRAALMVFTAQAAPQEWAKIQMGMAATHRDLVVMDANGSGLRDYLGRAIACYEQALRLYSESRHPQQWAHIQKEMGDAYAAAQSGGRRSHLERAIDCYQKALRTFSEHETPQEWASVMRSLGETLAEFPGGERGANLRDALACLIGALRIYNEESSPLHFAETNLQIGLTWGELAYLSDDRTAFRNAANYISTASEAFGRAGHWGEAAKARELAADISQSLQRAP